MAGRLRTRSCLDTDRVEGRNSILRALHSQNLRAGVFLGEKASAIPLMPSMQKSIVCKLGTPGSNTFMLTLTFKDVFTMFAGSHLLLSQASPHESTQPDPTSSSCPANVCQNWVQLQPNASAHFTCPRTIYADLSPWGLRSDKHDELWF